MQSFVTVFVKRIVLADRVELLTFVLSGQSKITFVPGQYVVLTIPSGGVTVKRLYSIANASSQQSHIDLLVKYIPGGAASNYLSTLPINQPLTIQGPAGVFSLKNTPADKVFFATGTGFAPIRSFILSNPTHKEEYHLFWGLPTLKEVYLFEEIKSLALSDPLFHPHICLSKETSLDHICEADQKYFSLGRIYVVWEGILGVVPGHEYYVCGRREMVEFLRDYLYDRNLDHKTIHFERY